MKILISAGSYKFHLAPLAAELDNKNALVGYITAGWPTGWQEILAKKFPDSPGWRRFLDRFEPIRNSHVYSIPSTELFFKVGDIFAAKYSKRLQQTIHGSALFLYKIYATWVLARTKPDIYHYRNCYGGLSVLAAKKAKIPSLCDHSIAHPVVLDWMENNRGGWPDMGLHGGGIRKELMPLYRHMASDIDIADYLIVNSDFVKKTCVHAGIDEKKVYVVYLGVDDAFYSALDDAEISKFDSDSARILFAGGWQRRKGVETLVDALSALKINWHLDIAGGHDADTLSLPAVSGFVKDSRVSVLGTLPRSELASLMKRHRIFVFPSYCEGSARVIFEAMAAGCYVITTENSGSIVQDKVHGAIVPPGDVHALGEAIVAAMGNPQLVDDIGRKNAELIRSQYRQKNYGLAVSAVYQDVLSNARSF